MISKVCKDPVLKDNCVNLTLEEPREFWCKCFPRYCDRGKEPPLVSIIVLPRFDETCVVIVDESIARFSYILVAKMSELIRPEIK